VREAVQPSDSGKYWTPRPLLAGSGIVALVDASDSVVDRVKSKVLQIRAEGARDVRLEVDRGVEGRADAIKFLHRQRQPKPKVVVERQVALGRLMADFHQHRVGAHLEAVHNALVSR
jgi:hypothetical protein